MEPFTESDAALYRALLAARVEPQSLEAFIVERTPRFPSPPHVKPLRDVFERIRRGEVVQALVHMAPRGCKTTTIQQGCAWLTNDIPAYQNAFISSGAEYATDRSREIQAWAIDAGVPDIYGPAYNWRTQQGGRLKAIGVRGQYVGTGTTGVQIIDDPYATPEDAMNVNHRAKVWEWYQGSAMNRREPGSSAIVCHTRWHTDDLIGRLMAEEPGEWEYICVPAVADFNEAAYEEYRELKERQAHHGFDLSRIGTSYWPSYVPMEFLVKFMANRYYWASLFQGDPQPRTGGMFKRENFEIVDALPAGGNAPCRGWDLAATEKRGSDEPAWTTGVKEKVIDGTLYILDVVRFRYEADKVTRSIVNVASQDGYGCKQSIPQDPGQAGKAQKAYLIKQLHGYDVHFSPESGSKEIRALPLASQVTEKNVKLLRGPWNATFLDEICMFPSGKFSDQVDGATRAYARLVQRAEAWSPSMPQVIRG